MTLVKFCGLTRAQDVEVAIGLGVQAIGFVFWPHSPRVVGKQLAADLVKRVPQEVARVGVFVEPTADDFNHASDLGIDIVQWHGGDHQVMTNGMAVWRARSAEAEAAAVPAHEIVLLDAHDPERHGGTGHIGDWHAARRLARTRPIVLAGGLTPANVGDAIRQVQPFGVDVSSGIEIHPGIKDPQAMRAFVAAVCEANR